MATSWTRWYNDDNRFGFGDNESLSQLRKKHDICGSNTPITAQCRQHGTSRIFTQYDRDFVTDRLIIPCTNQGIQCRNMDQIFTYCNDYEVRFMCPDKPTTPHNHNQDDIVHGVSDYGLIATAAGLSIIIPIVCVVLMQILKDYRLKRRQERLSTRHTSSTETLDVNQETFEYDNPPNYFEIFGQSSPILPSHTGTSTNTTVATSSQTVNAQTSDITHVYQISTTIVPQQQYQSSSLVTNGQEAVSVRTQDQSSEVDELPSYSDALILIGDIPPKYPG